MTLTRLSEIIHKRLGWCLNQTVTHVRKAITWQEMNSCVPPTPGSYENNGVIVDYGKTGIMLPYFIGALIGIIGIVAVFSLLIVRTGSLRLAAIPFFCLILLVTIFTIYQDLKKANLEITQDTLIIRRSLYRPVFIPKDTISAVEIRPNIPPLPLWLQKVMMLFIIPASSAVILYCEYLQFITGEITSLSLFLQIVFFISIVLLFLGSYYHSRVRADYPEILVITTNTQKLAGVYGDNFKEIVKMLGKSV